MQRTPIFEMAVIAPGDKVLVTGANGFLAAYLIQELLGHGYSVKGTVRSVEKADHIKSIFKDAVESGRLELVEVPDFLAVDAFDEAVKGVNAIAHTATPVTADAVNPWGESSASSVSFPSH